MEYWVTYVLESVDCQNSSIGLSLGVVHDVEVDEFFELQIVRLDAVQHLSKQC